MSPLPAVAMKVVCVVLLALVGVGVLAGSISSSGQDSALTNANDESEYAKDAIAGRVSGVVSTAADKPTAASGRVLLGRGSKFARLLRTRKRRNVRIVSRRKRSSASKFARLLRKFSKRPRRKVKHAAAAKKKKRAAAAKKKKHAAAATKKRAAAAKKKKHAASATKKRAAAAEKKKKHAAAATKKRAAAAQRKRSKRPRRKVKSYPLGRVHTKCPKGRHGRLAYACKTCYKPLGGTKESPHYWCASCHDGQFLVPGKHKLHPMQAIVIAGSQLPRTQQ